MRKGNMIMDRGKRRMLLPAIALTLNMRRVERRIAPPGPAVTSRFLAMPPEATP